MYNKLFTKILDSSIWLAPDPYRLVWITLIAAMDEDSNAMFACAENLAARARVPLDQTEAAIEAFMNPDPKGPDQEYEGRRIERIPGGWHILNGQKYRSMVTRSIAREQTRERVQRYRERKRTVTESNVTVTPSEAVSVSVTETEAPKSTSARKRASESEEPDGFAEFRKTFPIRAGSQPWQRAIKCWRARVSEGASVSEILAGARRYAAYIAATGKERTDMVLQAATFLGPDKHYQNLYPAPKAAETAYEEIQRLNGGHSNGSGRVFEGAEPGRAVVESPFRPFRG
jgi:hypothetical protein